MPWAERLFDRGTQLGQRRLRELGEVFKHARLQLGLSQAQVALAVHISQGLYSRIERGALPSLSVVLAARIAAVLGLDLVAKAYPGGNSIRDAGQAPRLRRLLDAAAKPLSYRTEVPLPRSDNGFEQRAWDAVIFGQGERTAVEFETRLYDLQAQERRLGLKLRDDPPDRCLVIVANTPANRRVLAEFEWRFAGLSRLRTATVLRELHAGRHPPTGLILL
jgi:transcriptional regulator with XRE-family HTH domain